MKYFVKVQDLDYDDYPVGTPTKIGPFYSEQAAEDFLDSSSRFHKVLVWTDYYEWRMSRRGKHSVSILPLSDGLQSPMNFV